MFCTALRNINLNPEDKTRQFLVSISACVVDRLLTKPRKPNAVQKNQRRCDLAALYPPGNAQATIGNNPLHRTG